MATDDLPKRVDLPASTLNSDEWFAMRHAGAAAPVRTGQEDATLIARQEADEDLRRLDRGQAMAKLVRGVESLEARGFLVVDRRGGEIVGFQCLGNIVSEMRLLNGPPKRLQEAKQGLH